MRLTIEISIDELADILGEADYLDREQYPYVRNMAIIEDVDGDRVALTVDQECPE